MRNEGQSLEDELRRKAPQTDPFLASQADLFHWPDIAPDFERLFGYVFTGSAGQREGHPMVFNLEDGEGKIALYPVRPNKKNGDNRRASQEELVAWKESVAEKAGLESKKVLIGPAYHEVDETILLDDGGTFPARVAKRDVDHLALYTEKRLP